MNVVMNEIALLQFDQPICKLTITDTLERISIMFVSPYVVKELGLSIEYPLVNGFKAIEDKGEVIIKGVNWKENYFGKISNGTEVPRLAGTAVMIRGDYFEKLEAIYEKDGQFILKREDSEN